MKKIVKISLMIALTAILFSCKGKIEKPRPPKPSDEKIDKGHEEPNKVEFIFTQMEKKGSQFTKIANTSQMITYKLDTDKGIKSEGDAIVWKENSHYLLEIVYYNSHNKRMNNEFVSAEMSKIHQHFFRMEGRNVQEMNAVLDYIYQDTDPENGTLGEVGVQLLRRTWDKKNPSAEDPIGLKGIFTTKKGIDDFNLKVTLAHFLGADRGFTKLKNGVARKYNEYPKASFFASDLNVKIPIKIEKHEEEHEKKWSKVEVIFHEGHTHGASFHGDPQYVGLKYLKSTQKVTYKLENKKWIRTGEKVVRWRQGSYYGVEIIYYDKDEKRLNSMILKNEKNHQHFFNFTNIKGIRGNTNIPAEKVIAPYKYRDTDPEDKYYSKHNKNVSLLKGRLGLKGYFHVKENYLSFDLKISLTHFVAPDKKIDGREREAYEFPKPRFAHVGFQMKIPVRIYTDRLSSDKVFYEDMSKEFGITVEEAKAEESRLLDADVDPEGNQVWM